MEMIESFLTKNLCYAAGKKIKVKGLMLHSVGCPQPFAMAFIRSWNVPKPNGITVCVHGFLQPDGKVYQTLPWDHRGWHGGGASNDTHIGIEMTEPATIRYTSGSSWTDTNPENTKAHVLGAYKTAVDLFAYLCKKYSLDPLKEGVIISHKEGHSRGIASNHGDPEHLWNRFGLTMSQFRKDVKATMEPHVKNYTKIAGAAQANADQMKKYIQKKNPKVPQSVLIMIPKYLQEGRAEGIRGDIAFAQSCLETGNFTFRDSAVTLDQNNFCGMGVTENGKKGNTFKNARQGIRAQVQHLKAYASKQELSKECVDPRFRYVERGCAEYVEWLGIQENPQRKGWAAGSGYGDKILKILQDVLKL